MQPPTEIHGNDDIHRRTLDWVILGIGCAVYIVALPFMVLTWKLRRKFYPIRLRYSGLTLTGCCGGFWWFAAQVSERQLLLQVDVLEPSAVNCWVYSVFRYLGMSLYFNALLCKQYKQHKKYVQVEPSHQSALIVLVMSIPFLVFMSVPASGMYDNSEVNTNGLCGTPNVMWRVTSCYTAFLFIPFAVLLRSLSDPCSYFPNFKLSCNDFAGFVVSSSTFLAMSWGCDSSSTSPPSILVTLHTVLGTVFTPIYLFTSTMAVPLYKWYIDDEDYVSEFERRMRANIQLPIGPGPLMYTTQSVGGTEFFEVEKLAMHVESGDPEQVKKWLAQTNLSNVNVPDKEGLTPLHRAVKNCNIAVTELLLDMDADPNVMSSDGLYPLQVASKRGSAECIFLLHRYGANINAKNCKGVTPLHVAIEYKQMGVLSLLLRLGGSCNDASPSGDGKQCDVTSTLPSGWNWDDVHCSSRGWMRDYRKNPLTLACELGYKDIVSFLIETTDIRADTCCVHGWNPLQLCCVLGHTHLIDYFCTLPESCVKPCYENPRDRRNVFHYCCFLGQDKCAATLIKYFYDEGAAPPRRGRGSPQNRVNIGTPEIYTETLNCEEGDGLLSCSASSAAVNMSGQPSRRRAQLDSMLNAQDYLGRTPLHYAVLGNHIKITQELLSEKVDTRLADHKDSRVDDTSPHIQPCKGYTVLEYATEAKNTQMVKILQAYFDLPPSPCTP